MTVHKKTFGLCTEFGEFVLQGEPIDARPVRQADLRRPARRERSLVRLKQGCFGKLDELGVRISRGAHQTAQPFAMLSKAGAVRQMFEEGRLCDGDAERRGDCTVVPVRSWIGLSQMTEGARIGFASPRGAGAHKRFESPISGHDGQTLS